MSTNEILWEQLRKLSNENKASILHFIFGAMEHNPDFIDVLEKALTCLRDGSL